MCVVVGESSDESVAVDHVLSMAENRVKVKRQWTELGSPQGAAASLFKLLWIQTTTFTKELRLTPIEGRCIVVTEGGEVGADAFIVVHAVSMAQVEAKVKRQWTVSGVSHDTPIGLVGSTCVLRCR